MDKSIPKVEKSATRRDERTRSFATVVYPESAPEQWFNIFELLKIPALISPLHDRDINPDGTVKKAHYHVCVFFEGKKSSEQVREIFATFGGVGLETINSIRGYARYLCHLDNPEKAQYSPSEVRSFGGMDYRDITSSAADRHALIREMASFCRDNNITEFADLYEYALDYNEEWFNALSDNAGWIFDKLIRSRRHRSNPLLRDEDDPSV